MTDDYQAPYDADPADAGTSAPRDLDAEQAYLGALILTPPRDQRRVHQLLAAGDFYRLGHGTIHQAAAAILDRAATIDPITLAAELQRVGELEKIGGTPYFTTCMTQVTLASSAPQYAERIKALALRRALIEAGTEIARRAFDPAAEPDDLAENAVTLAREVRDAGRAAQDTPVTDMWDFLDAGDDEPDWIVPGLLERMDRLILTGGEGGGKSVLMRQLAVCLAAGIHPFQHTPNPVGPARVLVLDCENSEQQNRRRYRPLMNCAAAAHLPVKRGALHIDCRPEGIDLTRADGRAWLMRRVETVMPDVLVIGPVYQLHSGDPASEEHARKVTIALTEARVTAGCALLMEAHAPHANGFGPRALRPAGSSLWMRWPEFGFGLRPVEDERSAEDDRARRLVPWRGMRDDRQFPQFIRQGWLGTNPWPWVEYRPIDADQFTGRSATGATS
ncbi:AAA family ATPase [Actinacidiphila sp. bgisy145]|uniref:AAA family ATPase n=1 Tax=Actinacidiphila sp. bgisy145 TaxID=3413792 RepID=UPI003EBF5E06